MLINRLPFFKSGSRQSDIGRSSAAIALAGVWGEEPQDPAAVVIEFLNSMTCGGLNASNSLFNIFL